MRVLLQRVVEAAVTIDGVVRGSIAHGLVALVGFTASDTTSEVEWMADKIVGLRVFADPDGKTNLDVGAVGGSVMVVSQFTLYGDAERGRRPSFIAAAPPATAIPLYEAFVAGLRSRGLDVATGEFGADMKVALINDGPVTLMLERHAS